MIGIADSAVDAAASFRGDAIILCEKKTHYQTEAMGNNKFLLICK